MPTVTFITDSMANNAAANGFTYGHFYLRLEGDNLPVVEKGKVPSGYYGKYPQENKPVDKQMILDEKQRYEQAKASGAKIIESAPIQLTEEEYIAVKKYITRQIEDKERKDGYNLISDNCVDFDQGVWMAMGRTGAFTDADQGKFTAAALLEMDSGAAQYTLGKYTPRRALRDALEALNKEISEAFDLLIDDLNRMSAELEDALGFGDLHLITFKDKEGQSLAYDVQRPGDLVLTKSTDPNMPYEVQVRQELYKEFDSVSVVKHAGVKLSDNTVVEISLPPKDAECSTEQDDYIAVPNGGTAANPTEIYPGGDSGVATLVEEGEVVTTDARPSGPSDVFGYFVNNGTAEAPVYTGKIISVNTNPEQGVKSASFPGLEEPFTRVEYFLIPGGNIVKNPGLIAYF